MAGFWQISSLMHLHFSRIQFVLLLRHPIPVVSLLLSYFGRLSKHYYPSIISIVLYLTYFTVRDIVSSLCVAPFIDDFTPICSYAPRYIDSILHEFLGSMGWW